MTIVSRVQKKKTAVSMAIFVILAGSVAGVYLANRTPSSSSLTSRSAANVINSNAPASQVVGSRLQEAISNARSKLPCVNSDLAMINAKGISGNVAGLGVSGLEIAETMNSFEITVLEPKMLKAMQTAPAGESISKVETSVINSIIGNDGTYLDEALSNTVLDMMLLSYAKATGREVPYAQAQAQADKNWAEYVKSGSPPLRLMNGKTAKDQFDSPAAVRALQDGLTIAKMRNQIGGPQYGSQGQNNQRPAFVAWMTANLNKYHVTIHNSPVPISELPKYLPAMM